jgi:hypothetical protein
VLDLFSCITFLRPRFDDRAHPGDLRPVLRANTPGTSAWVRPTPSGTLVRFAA